MSEPTISITRSSTSSISTDVPRAPRPQLKTHVVDLPSTGYFYNQSSPLSSGKIELYQVTAKHEDILSNSALIKKGTVLDEFLKSIIATPGVSLDDIIVGDKNALLVKSRILAYGKDYSVKMKCSECGTESKVNVDLSTIKAKDFDFSKHVRGENSFSTTLSDGKKVKIKLLTHKDETDIEAEIKSMSKVGVNTNEITTRLKYVITSIDGDTDRQKIKKYVDNELLSADSLTLRKLLRVSNPDMDMTFDFTCPVCGHVERKTVPVNTEFFWPSSND